MVSLNQAFKIIASMYRTLNRQIVELDDQIEELETIIYAPVTGDLSRVISSKTTKTGKTNSKVALFSKLDKFVEMRTFKRDITDEIERLQKLINGSSYSYETAKTALLDSVEEFKAGAPSDEALKIVSHLSGNIIIGGEDNDTITIGQVDEENDYNATRVLSFDSA